MKRFYNNFIVTAKIANKPKVYKLEKSSVARFSILLSRRKGYNSEGNPLYVSEFLPCEWWQNEPAKSLPSLSKGQRMTFSGEILPDLYKSKAGAEVRGLIFMINNAVESPDGEDCELLSLK